MKTKIVVLLFLAAFIGCSEDDEAVADEFSIEGDWVALSWYCNNDAACAIDSEDWSSTFEFKVVKEKGQLKAINGVVTSISCLLNPYCNAESDGLLFFESFPISFKNDVLQFDWEGNTGNQFEFNGKRVGDQFQGSVTHAFSAGMYTWNDNITIVRGKANRPKVCYECEISETQTRPGLPNYTVKKVTKRCGITEEQSTQIETKGTWTSSDGKITATTVCTKI